MPLNTVYHVIKKINNSMQIYITYLIDVNVMICPGRNA